MNVLILYIEQPKQYIIVCIINIVILFIYYNSNIIKISETLSHILLGYYFQ